MRLVALRRDLRVNGRLVAGWARDAAVALREETHFRMYRNTVLSQVQIGAVVATSWLRGQSTASRRTVLWRWRDRCLHYGWSKRVEHKTVQAQHLMDQQAQRMDDHVEEIATKLSSERRKVKVEKQARRDLEVKIGALEKILYK